MNNDVPADDHNDVPADNAPFYFDRYPPETAHWLAEICDDATVKAGDSPTEFRKVMCERIKMGIRDGVIHAFRAADQIIAANAPGAKHIEQQYLKYDQARAAVIETGPQAKPGPTTTAGPKTDDPGQPASGTEGQHGRDGKTPSGPGCGAGTMAGAGTAVTFIEGSGRKTTENGKGTGTGTGTGHQGTLFIVQYADYRASIPARRKKAQTEQRRLYDVQSDAARQMRVHEDELAFLDRLEAADPVLEDLINTHRAETSIAGVLSAAGRTPEDLGLTKETVAWLDRQLKAA
ncbi:hypothetical protein ACFRIC_16810 [Streptomyces sp. NPDC056738]|uniref:hypothetical protein n=1 Tax=Streptomyces sp. NPDC056738 TaxID=3345933 RepID=UPI0036969709